MLKFNDKKTMKKWTKGLNRHLNKDDIQMANKHVQMHNIRYFVVHVN